MTQAPKHPEQDAPKTAADQPTEPTARFGRLADSIVTLVLAVLVAFGLGLGAYHFFLAGDDDAGEKAGPSTTANAGHRHGQQAGDEQADLWICSMHPDVTSSGPGLCPICNMELVPATGGSDPTGPLELTPAASQALRIQVAPIERRFVTARIEMIGQVAYDETRIARTTAWIPGRLERLYVDFTGMAVRKGDHMVDIYSPELLAAQAEWIQASRALGTLDSDASEIIRQTTRAGAEAAAGKLQLMGLTDEQIQQIARRGEPSDTLTIYAPQGGIVIRKHAQQGDYVQVGSPIYTIADLQKVWVKFDAYESDVQWLRLGQPVRFSVRSYPGEVFTGRISFLSPTVDPESRTVRVRVTADNENGRLKPQMTVSAIVESQIASGGKVVEPDLADKFLCPMHPSVVSDEPGQCPICQMDLEQAGSLGYAPATGQSQPSLVVPVSAVLW
ncbi:MAG: efflux RND transporter periplasmic adaptor subunit, partial [Planctomycetota bacterium]